MDIQIILMNLKKEMGSAVIFQTLFTGGLVFQMHSDKLDV